MYAFVKKAPSEKYFFVPTTEDSFRYCVLTTIQIYRGKVNQQLLMQFKAAETYYSLITIVMVGLFLITSLLILYGGHKLFEGNLMKQLGMLALNFLIFLILIGTFSYYQVDNGNSQLTLSIHEKDILKFDVVLGSIPMNNEVTVDFTSTIRNNDTFWTDENGLEM